jgi:hypothetical protein
MVHVTSCPTCSNATVGESLFTCSECAKVYCQACVGSGSFLGGLLSSGSPCPGCGTRNEASGKIEEPTGVPAAARRDDDDEDDEDDEEDDDEDEDDDDEDRRDDKAAKRHRRDDD